MGFTADQIRQIAEIRGDFAVLAKVNGEDHWLLPPSQHTDTRRLAECLNTDDWLAWQDGLLGAFDNEDVPLFDNETVHDWSTRQPVKFVAMRWCAVEVCGMGRGRVVSEHASEASAKNTKTVRAGGMVRYLRKGSRGMEVLL